MRAFFKFLYPQTLTPIITGVLGARIFTRILALGIRALWVIAWLGLVWVTGVGAVSLVSLASGDKVPLIVSDLSFKHVEPLIVWMVGGTLICVGAIITLSLLQGVFATLVAGDPFVPANADRLRLISITLALLEAARTALALFAGAPLGINVAVWIGVVVLIVLAQVFVEGASLREERNLTI